MFTRAMQRLERANPVLIGLVLLTLVLVGGTALFKKTQISTALSSGDTVQAAFERNYRLRAHVTEVKIAGVPVGLVTDVERNADEFLVSMKLDDGAKDRLGATPSAAVRPTTLMGGNYYIDLRPGGKDGEFTGDIPVSRTTVPVELDRVLEVLKPSVRESLPRTVGRLDASLERDGQRAVRKLTKAAPGTLEPAGEVLNALRGTRPGQDLQDLVTDLGSLAEGLSRSPEELDGAVKGLHRTSGMLADTRQQVADAVESLPGTLRNTRTGLASLSGTLDQLEKTAHDARPAARALDPLLEELEPALRELRPVVRDLRPTLVDLRPLVEDLVPTATTARRVLDDVDGDPLKRVNGPIMDTVLSPWKGTGDYEGGGNDTVFYKELGNLIAGMNNAGRMTDRNGSTIHFQPGFGIGSLSGTPISFERLLKQLLYPQGDQ